MHGVVSEVDVCLCGNTCADKRVTIVEFATIPFRQLELSESVADLGGGSWGATESPPPPPPPPFSTALAQYRV